jgi:hypothetical protein
LLRSAGTVPGDAVIRSLETALRGIGGGPSLCAALERALAQAQAPARFQQLETLRPGEVHRLRFAGSGPGVSLVIKRLRLDRAHREQRALRHWLPQLGLGDAAVPLLAVVPDMDASRLWHVYEDLGDHTLAQAYHDDDHAAEATRTALALVSALHLRFAAQPVLMDCRLAGLDLGAAFFATAISDAQRSLAALRALEGLGDEWRAPIDALLERLARLDEESAARGDSFAALAWPETLLHGDLWLENFVVTPDGAGRCVRLIDWERTGVGSPLYDLSTFLRQLPPHARAGALEAYRQAVECAGWPWPASTQLECVAETCELGRFASCLAWRVLPFLEMRGDAEPAPAWLLDDLVEMERWFAERTPLFPTRCAA